LEHDILGLDFNLNLKAANPWPTDLTGIYIGSYLQSVTKNLALGTEWVYQRPTPTTSDLVASYLAKYTSSDKSWIATAQLQPGGMLQATYWQRLSEKVEFAADVQLMASPMRRDALATLGAKYDLRLATFRAQLDSTGKVSALLEQRFTPMFAFLMSGEIDHFKVRCLTNARRCCSNPIMSFLECCQGWCRCDDRELSTVTGRVGDANAADADATVTVTPAPVMIHDLSTLYTNTVVK
jgi:hypothetical protein